MALKTIWRFIAHHWKTAFQELWDDLRTIRWARALGWFSFLVIWCGGLVVAITFVALVGSSNSPSLFDSVSPCLPGGSFSLRPDLYNPWTASGAFEITLGFGNLSFANAKLIDVIWDGVIGRGLQIFLSLISCFVFAQYITATMAVSPVSYATYSTVFFRIGPNAASIFTLLRDFIFYRALDSKFAMVWMILSASFVAAFPTWVSAMSGYSGNSGAFIKDVNGNFVSFSEFEYIEYVVHDGDRIGLNKDYYVTGNFSTVVGIRDLGNTCDWYATNNSAGYPVYDYVSYNIPPPDCFLRFNISSYVATYGFYGTNNTNSTFENYTLPAPSLNISAYYIASTVIYGGAWIDPSTGKQPFANYSDATFLSSGVTYPLDYMSQNGSCQPLGTYHWGFSFLLLFIFLLTLFIWSIGTYIFWLRAHHTLRVREIHEIPGEYKAVIELAAAMRREFSKEGKDPTCLKEHQIIREIHRDLKGGRIMHENPITQQSKHRFRVVLVRWFKRDRWWLLGYVILTVIWITLLLPGLFDRAAFFFFILSLTTSLGILLAMFIGRKTGSRVLMVLFSVVVGIITACSV